MSLFGWIPFKRDQLLVLKKRINREKNFIIYCQHRLDQIIKKYNELSQKEDNVKKQGKKDKMDESLGMRRGKESTKKQSYKSRRHESTGMKKAMAKKKK